MGHFFRLLTITTLFSPLLLSATPVKEQIIMEPIIISVSARSCGDNNKIDMHDIPGWGNTWQITPDCRAPTTRETDIALNLFLETWKETFGDPGRIVENNLRDMIIVWAREKQTSTGYTETGERFEDAEVIGLTSNPGYIWVSLNPSRNNICNSSFVHELVHASIWAIKKTDGDPDHLGPIYDGWTPEHSAFIRALDHKICILGL